jgi:hypothetical protein
MKGRLSDSGLRELNHYLTFIVLAMNNEENCFQKLNERNEGTGYCPLGTK